jgi:hypothetical protein
MHPDYARAHYGLRQEQTRTDLWRQEHAAAIRDARQGRSTWTIIISASRPN